MIRAQAGQSVSAQMLNATGAAFSGTVTVYVTLDAGTQAIGSVGSGLCTSEGNGLFSYRPSLQETDGAKCDFTFIGTGAIPTTIQYPTITLAQQATLIASTVSGAVSVLAICLAAGQELSLFMKGEVPDADDGALILGKLNRLIDNWNADQAAIYSVQFQTFTLVPSLSPHTIGPSGASFTTAQRPVSIEAASLLLSGGVRVPIDVLSVEDYNGLSLPSLTSTIAQGVFYNPTWPNGELYFYPVPASAASVELLTRSVLSQVTLVDTVTLPPGYLDAIILTLAEEIAAPFGAEIPAHVETSARAARARIAKNNDRTPRFSTADAGMPGSGRRPRGNYLTGWQ